MLLKIGMFYFKYVWKLYVEGNYFICYKILVCGVYYDNE